MSVRCTVLAVVLVSLFACSGQPVNVTELLNHGQCSKLRAGLTQVEFADLPAIRGVRLLSTPDAPADDDPEQASASATEDVLLFAISRGSQPTPGYGFELQGALADGREVRLDYAWRTPPADAVLAQVVTSPCSVVQIDDGGLVQAVSAWLDGAELYRSIVERAPATTSGQ